MNIDILVIFPPTFFVFLTFDIFIDTDIFILGYICSLWKKMEKEKKADGS